MTVIGNQWGKFSGREEVPVGSSKYICAFKYTFFFLYLKENLAIFYMLSKYVPGDIKYIFTKFYRHISTNNEANRIFVILISNFSTSL